MRTPCALDRCGAIGTSLFHLPSPAYRRKGIEPRKFIAAAFFVTILIRRRFETFFVFLFGLHQITPAFSKNRFGILTFGAGMKRFADGVEARLRFGIGA